MENKKPKKKDYPKNLQAWVENNLGKNLATEHPQKLIEDISNKTNQLQQSDLLAHELAKRYGSESWKDIANSFQGDVGLDPYTIPIKVEPAAFGAADGTFSPSSGRISISPNSPGGLSRSAFPTTAVHELGHAWDDVRGIRSKDAQHHSQITPLHPGENRDIGSFEPNTIALIAAQNAKENDLPMNPAYNDMYPNLRDVKPLSSNPLAGPWQGIKGEEKLPPDLWNAIKER